MVVLVASWILWEGWIPVDRILLPGVIMLITAMLLGAPIFSVLGGATLLYLWAGGFSHSWSGYQSLLHVHGSTHTNDPPVHTCWLLHG